MADQHGKTKTRWGRGDAGREIAAGSFCAALLALGFLATVVAVAPPRANPFGLMVGGGALGLERRAGLARELGMTYFRPWDLNMADWADQHRDAEYFQKAGFRLVMTVRNAARGTPARPGTFPTDAGKYAETLSAVLETCRPEVIAVENEENSPASYAGTVQQYARELKIACDVAHAHGVKCTNGGLTNGLLALLVWDDYMARGDRARAEAFLERAATSIERQQLRSPLGRTKADDAIRNGKALLAAYKAAGADFVNFHWSTTDARALEEAVAFLRSRTPLPPISNQLGLREQDEKTVTALLRKVLDLEMPIAVWDSVDRLQSRALQDPDGKWRPSGLTAKKFLWRRLP